MIPRRLNERGVRVHVLLALALVVTLVAAPAADAIETDTFRVDPWPLDVGGHARRSFDHDLEPGSAVTDAVRITNTSEHTRRFRVQATDAQRDPSGQLSLGGRGSRPQGMGSWIALDRDEVEVAPGASEIVGFRLSRPEGEEVEGFAAIAVEELREVQGPGVDVVHRLALLVRLDGAAASLRATRPELHVPLRPVPSQGNVSTVVHNDTLGRTDAVVRFGVAGLTGRSWVLEEVTVSLAPGERRRVEQTWHNVPRWGGSLRPEVEVTSPRGTLALVGHRSLYPPLWLLALVILAVGLRAIRELRAGGRDRYGTAAPQAPLPDQRDRPRVEELVGS